MNGQVFMQGKIIKQNFFCGHELKEAPEIYDEILSRKNFLLERIVSKGYKTPEKKWLVSRKDEWVILLKGKAKIRFANGIELDISEGDFISIPKNTKHKVTFTSKRPECIWLALHFKNY